MLHDYLVKWHTESDKTIRTDRVEVEVIREECRHAACEAALNERYGMVNQARVVKVEELRW